MVPTVNLCFGFKIVLYVGFGKFFLFILSDCYDFSSLKLGGGVIGPTVVTSARFFFLELPAVKCF